MSTPTQPLSYDPAAEVVEICRDLIRMDTTNYGDGSGPGERKAAEHVAALLAEVGIESEIFEGAPGRANVVARWGGRGTTDNALLLHGHLDVVPANADDWAVPPFSGEITDGYLWGRGAVDMKDFDAMVLSVVRARARAGMPPERPVVLCFTADEEAGGHQGAEQVVRQRPDLLEGCTEGIGEVGGWSATVRGRRFYLVEAAEKGMAWMRLTATGNAGHGSMRAPRQRRDPAGGGGGADRPPRVAGAADPGDAGAAVLGRRAGRRRGHARERRGAGRRVRPGGPDARRGAAQHRRTRRCCRPATR